MVDSRRRRAEIIEAAWHVLVRDGANAVSVRGVATQAGLATASLRRAFPSQSELLAACLALVGDRVESRIRALPRVSDPVEQAVALLSETLPLDNERRIEMHVYLTLGTAALSDATLGSAYHAISNDLLDLCRQIVAAMQPCDGPDDRQREAARLSALVDGIALHTLHGHDHAQAVDILRNHLLGLMSGHGQ